MTTPVEFASRPSQERLARRVHTPDVASRGARRLTLEALFDLERLLRRAVLEQAVFLAAIRARLVEAAESAARMSSPEMLPPVIADADTRERFAERIAELLVAARVLGRARTLEELRWNEERDPASGTGAANVIEASETLGPVGVARTVERLRALRIVTRDEWDRLTAAERNNALTMAGVSERRTLEAMRNLVARSIEEGWTVDHFVTEAQRLVSLAQADPRHLRTVWQTNLGRQMDVGREEELRRPEVARFLTHRLFDAIADNRVRPNHSALDNGIAPVEWWDTVRPDLKPRLGFNCRCQLFAVNPRRAQRMIESGEATDLTLGVPFGAHRDPNFAIAA